MQNTMTPILKLADFCNFDCGFCRYAQSGEGSPLMSLDIAETAILDTAQHNLDMGARVAHIIFHGGEPLLWGKERFREIHEVELAFCEKNPGFRFFNSIQTNGYLIDREWAHIFSEMEMDVGISHDGPSDLNSHFGRCGCTDISKVVELLEDSKVRHGILSVITNAHRGRAKDYYNFLIASSIRSAGLCYCFDPDGKNTVRNDNLASFLIELFDLYFYGDYELDVREFENAILGVLGKDIPSCCNKCRSICGNHFTVLPNGDMQFCDSYEVDGERSGNITVDGIDGYLKSSRYKNTLLQLRKNFDRHCSRCEVLEVCRGGCFRNDIEDGRNCFCDAYKALYMHVKAVVQQANTNCMNE